MCALHAEAQPAEAARILRVVQPPGRRGDPRLRPRRRARDQARGSSRSCCSPCSSTRIYHLFTVLPTSFVPNEDQGYVMAAIIMPEAASIDRTQAVAEKVDAIFAKIPGVETRSMITGYSLLDSGFKTNAGTFFVTLKDFKERYASIETAKDAERARGAARRCSAKRRRSSRRSSFRSRRRRFPGIGTTGGFEFWIQDTGAGDPAQLDEVTQDFLRKARARPELASLSTRTFRANTQQLRANVDRDKATLLGVPDRGRLQRDPGAVRLADGEPVQPVQPRLVGDRAVRREVSAGSRRPDAPVHALEATARWCRCRRWSRRNGSRGPISCRTSTAFPRRRSTATRRRATAPATRSPRWRRSRAKCCRPATRSRGRASRSRRRSPAARR